MLAVHSAEDNPDGKSTMSVNFDAERRASISKDDEEEMVAEDGHIMLPDCLCAVCHRYASTTSLNTVSIESLHSYSLDRMNLA